VAFYRVRRPIWTIDAHNPPDARRGPARGLKIDLAVKARRRFAPENSRGGIVPISTVLGVTGAGPPVRGKRSACAYVRMCAYVRVCPPVRV
jgi:hypothetical protein